MNGFVLSNIYYYVPIIYIFKINAIIVQNEVVLYLIEDPMKYSNNLIRAYA